MRAALLLVALVLAACGPALHEPSAPGESCSNDHTDYWRPGPSVTLMPEASTAACNTVPYFSKGGGQTSFRIHIEPELAIERQQGRTPVAVTYGLFVLGTDFARGEQSFEIFAPAGGDAFVETSQLFLESSDVGRNRLLLATVEWLELDGTSTNEVAQAALYVERPQ